MKTQPFLSERHQALARAVALPAAALLLLLSIIVGGILHISTTRSDELALERQHKLVWLALSQSVTAIAIDQEASTLWDDAVIRTRQRPLDLQWLDNNLGVWFHSYYSHDETYLLDPADRPVYAMQAGHRARPVAFGRVDEAALPLARSLRKRLATSHVAPEGSAGQTIGDSEIRAIDGRPAIISLKPIVSETGE